MNAGHIDHPHVASDHRGRCDGGVGVKLVPNIGTTHTREENESDTTHRSLYIMCPKEVVHQTHCDNFVNS